MCTWHRHWRRLLRIHAEECVVAHCCERALSSRVVVNSSGRVWQHSTASRGGDGLQFAAVHGSCSVCSTSRTVPFTAWQRCADLCAAMEQGGSCQCELSVRRLLPLLLPDCVRDISRRAAAPRTVYIAYFQTCDSHTSPLYFHWHTPFTALARRYAVRTTCGRTSLASA